MSHNVDPHLSDPSPEPASAFNEASMPVTPAQPVKKTSRARHPKADLVFHPGLARLGFFLSFFLYRVVIALFALSTVFIEGSKAAKGMLFLLFGGIGLLLVSRRLQNIGIHPLFAALLLFVLVDPAFINIGVIIVFFIAIMPPGFRYHFRPDLYCFVAAAAWMGLATTEHWLPEAIQYVKEKTQGMPWDTWLDGMFGS